MVVCHVQVTDGARGALLLVVQHVNVLLLLDCLLIVVALVSLDFDVDHLLKLLSLLLLEVVGDWLPVEEVAVAHHFLADCRQLTQ